MVNAHKVLITVCGPMCVNISFFRASLKIRTYRFFFFLFSLGQRTCCWEFYFYSFASHMKKMCSKIALYTRNTLTNSISKYVLSTFCKCQLKFVLALIRVTFPNTWELWNANSVGTSLPISMSNMSQDVRQWWVTMLTDLNNFHWKIHFIAWTFHPSSALINYVCCLNN